MSEPGDDRRDRGSGTGRQPDDATVGDGPAADRRGIGGSAPGDQGPGSGAPRPQFGEYASPEEQRSRTRDADSGRVPPGASYEPLKPATDPVARSVQKEPLRGWRLADRVVAAGLLVYGLLTIVATVPRLVSFGEYAEMLLTTMGVEQDLSDPAAGRPWGTAAAVVLAVGWVLTAWLAWRFHRRGRLVFWIPIAGALLWNLVSSVLSVIPIMNDPAAVDAILQSVG